MTAQDNHNPYFFEMVYQIHGKQFSRKGKHFACKDNSINMHEKYLTTKPL